MTSGASVLIGTTAKSAALKLLITTESIMTKASHLSDITPGEILFEEFMKPYGLSQNGLAGALGVSPMTVNQIIHGKRAITAEVALRLGRYFGMSPQFWLNLQTRHDLEKAEDSIGKRLRQEVRPLAAA
jgi:antitoxin HigA-1